MFIFPLFIMTCKWIIRARWENASKPMFSFCSRIIFDICIWYVELQVVFMLFTHNISNNQRTHFSILVLIWHTTIKSYLLLRTLFFYEILFYLSIRCPLILPKKLKAHMSTVDGKQYVINAHEAFCHTLF